MSLDTTRADRLGCYGHFRNTSPHLDRFASEGVLFTDHFSPHIPYLPRPHHNDDRKRYLRPSCDQPISYSGANAWSTNACAEILKEKGYFTAAADNLGRWFSRGFDRTESYSWDTQSTTEWCKGEAVRDAAIKALDAAAAQDSPFFLFLHFWDPHTPYLPPAPFHRMFYGGDEKDPANDSMDALWQFENFNRYFAEWMGGVTDIEYPKAQYDAEIAYMDCCFSHVLNRMDELGLSGDTLIVVTADHGEELDEHGHWFDHHGLYDTNIHIPLIMRCPSLLPSGVRIGGLTTMLDVAPTILDLLDLGDIAIAESMIGTTLVQRLINSPASTSRGTTDYIHITENTWMKKRGIRTHRWKLIVPLETPDIHGNSDIELYHLTHDPGELNNIAAVRPEVTARLMRLMDEWVSARLEATGLEDPLPIQPIPLKRVGSMDAAVPDDRSSVSRSNANMETKSWMRATSLGTIVNRRDTWRTLR